MGRKMTGEESKVEKKRKILLHNRQIIVVTTKNLPSTDPILACSYDSILIATTRMMGDN